MITICNKESLLIDLLASLAPESSKTTLRSWIKEGRITINGSVAKRADLVVSKGQKVTLGPKISYIASNIPIIYEDRYLVAIDKPAGILSVATAFQKENTLHSILKRHYHPRKVFVVHRLDQETSGVMLFALSEKSHQGLKSLFETHAIERRYCAIVEGEIKSNQGSWQSYLYEDSQYRVHSTDDSEQGILAMTHYLLEESTPRYSRLLLTLETGRKNQIRVHCQDHSHPIAGDKKYGAASDPIKRLCLHAQSIAFKHPITEKMMHFESPVPSEFDRLTKSRSHA